VIARGDPVYRWRLPRYSKLSVSISEVDWVERLRDRIDRTHEVPPIELTSRLVAVSDTPDVRRGRDICTVTVPTPVYDADLPDPRTIRSFRTVGVLSGYPRPQERSQ
jgi:hypothetical protein